MNQFKEQCNNLKTKNLNFPNDAIDGEDTGYLHKLIMSQIAKTNM